MTEPLWSAVDAITKPTSKPILRDQRREWLVEIEDELTGFCRVDQYRAAVGSSGVVPSLWVQAEMALHKTGETDSGNRSHLATRSPADVALMETMLSIRELISQQFVYFRNIKRPLDGPPKPDVPGQLRQLASHILTHFPSDVDEWAYRIGQWQRLLENYLQAVETGPKPMRLRVRCPRCYAEHIKVDMVGSPEKVLARPILAVYREGQLQCLQCQSCGYAWFGPTGVHQLDAEITQDEEYRRSLSDPDSRIAI